jgi:hypothetical protein
MQERQAPRQKTFLRGFVYFEGSPLAVECLVREMSETGARLKFATPPPPIHDIELHIPIKGHKCTAKVIWRAADEFGVTFVDASKGGNSGPSDGELSDRVARLEDEIVALKQLIILKRKPSESKTEAA